MPLVFQPSIQSIPTHDSVLMPRAVLVVMLASMVIWPSIYQNLLDSIYKYLLASAIYRASIFETVWTVLLYSLVEMVYTRRFGHHPQLRLVNQSKNSGIVAKPPPQMRRPKHRLLEGLTYVAPLLLLDFTMIKKFGGVAVQDMALSGNYDPSTVKMRGNFLAPSLHRFTWDSPLQTQRALPRTPPSSRQLVLELATSILIYDTVFFWFHLALHKVPYLRRLHGTHHDHNEIYPQITNQLDIVERLGLVLLANFSLNIIGSHVLTRTLFVPMFVWLLVDIHSGMDQPWSYDKLLPKGWAAGSKRHSYHHQHNNMYYEPFFNWWDDLLAWTSASKRP